MPEYTEPLPPHLTLQFISTTITVWQY